MALVFPKKKKKKFPTFLILSIFTTVLMFATIFGEGGVLHAFAMRIHKKQAEELAVAQDIENQKISKMIYYVRKNPQQARLYLADRGVLAEEGAVIYRFRDITEVNSNQVIDEIEGLSWTQKIGLRLQLLKRTIWE